MEVLETKHEQNVIIADFMDVKTEMFKSNKLNYMYTLVGGIEEGFEAHELSYDVSWNLLMPVWRKLRSNLRDVIDNGDAETVSFLYDEILSAIGTADIDYAYPKIVKGIKWVNENK